MKMEKSNSYFHSLHDPLQPFILRFELALFSSFSPFFFLSITSLSFSFINIIIFYDDDDDDDNNNDDDDDDDDGDDEKLFHQLSISLPSLL